jgi:alginate O-acetyltransferase complex protein AlgI
MNFLSFSFLGFFIIFYFLYWSIKAFKIQNILLLVGSYIFYLWLDWWFLLFLVSVTTLNYFLGIYIDKTAKAKPRKWLLLLGIFQGVGSLAYFKYFNFFIASINSALLKLGINSNLNLINIILPLGISYFTFRTISYLLDVDKGKIKATQDYIVFANYLSFFPTLLSGPIDKARTFVPQLEVKREFNYSKTVDGLRQILWGIFKKMVIADNCAMYANDLFAHSDSLPASSLVLASFFYTFQIYADFSAYSDIAIGLSRLLGFKVTKNFDNPFFALNISDFWRKWHISLTSWLTEYVFTPLSILFRNFGKRGLILAIVINFTLVGIWHGANWTYVLFGFIHGCLFIPPILRGTLNKKRRIAKNKLLPSFKELLQMSILFIVVMLTFVIFRAQNIDQAIGYFSKMWSSSLFSIPQRIPKTGLVLVFVMMAIEWLGRDGEYALERLGYDWKRPLRYAFYYALVFAILWFGGQEQQFIYFQF